MRDGYLFRSDRLGFRGWTMEDLDDFARINADLEVMEHFPRPLTRQETAEFIVRLQNHQAEHGHCYFATELLQTGELIGFIGPAHQTYPAPFTPATDVGWRLKRTAWGKGYATEGAKRCLAFAFEHLKLERVVAVCTVDNHKSENVMKKLGMTKMGEFKNPRLSNYPDLERCVWYQIESS
ncbi:MAG: GNAT family N-acetyltransferase [Catalinimonas sp.]